MLLSLLIIIPFFSSFFSFFSYNFNKNIPRWTALIGTISTLLVVIILLIQENYCFLQDKHYPNWDYQFIIPWIPSFGISFNIAIDGLSIVMLIFASLLSMIAIVCSWNEIKTKEGFFYFNLMLVFSGIIGIFISIDLFLFFFFWEIILIPMYFLIALWGYKDQKENSCLAANKFFIYGQISGLILLSSILLLVFNHYQITHIITFDYNLLLHASLNQYVEYIIMLGFFFAFAIKMPIVPFHGWLPDMHVQSSSCGSVEIIGILLKTAPYALLRYHLVLFPHSIEKFAPVIMFLGLVSIFYGAILAFAQTNIKRLIAYSSISHMGLILIAIYSNNEISLQGVIIQMLSNSVSTAALCILSGQLYKRLKTQDMRLMGGLWSYVYWIPGFTLFFSLANLGIPGTGNFIGEFLILSGLFQFYPLVSILATTGIVFSSIYSLNMIHKIFYGSPTKNFPVFFVNKQELWTIIVLIFMLVFLGLNPQKIIDTSYNSIHNIQKEFNYSILKIRL
ncbi:NADH-quinone oxidoreductase subunit M [Buchnera aphidicola (Brachycaudus cardui)]|uniref:NADH-quinone oxidoreductase subunit M n=1 Tax=Buchnera aphidicola (Brachycaudus cardui) TaxID=557993 RepID=A0A4D6XWV7_9GAMM|nr:NADH-quinone oxidoreductase subunit M [Buchnera aphidicola]QCI20317.1 NADH-quinone oxidoreductase subunit M [Buchnera aphidicola (Brachycaudus cardui)]